MSVSVFAPQRILPYIFVAITFPPPSFLPASAPTPGEQCSGSAVPKRPPMLAVMCYISCIVYLARIHVFTLFLLMCPDCLLLSFFS